MDKLFIISLPRTGTTSISLALMDAGLKVAHTAYTIESFEQADVISDSPCYCDYPHLDALYPDSRFLFLERDLTDWLPSMRLLLEKIAKYIQPDGPFNPIIKRCFRTIFAFDGCGPLPVDEEVLASFHSHKNQVFDYFAERNDWMTLNIKDPEAPMKLWQFLGIDESPPECFPHLNQGRMITAWKDIKHPNKVNSVASGPMQRKFFDYV